MTMLTHTLLENQTASSADIPAIWDKRWFTYLDVNKAANRIANYLIRKGISKGDRVAFLLENSFEYLAVYFGVLKAGCVAVGLNTETTPQAIKYILGNSDARLLISQKSFRKHLLTIRDTLRHLNGLALKGGTDDFDFAESLENILENESDLTPYVRMINLDIAAIVYTSGSTGKPKGVVLSHLNLVTNTRSIIAYLELSAKDRMMVVLPFYYIYGLSLLNTHIAVGGSLVVDNRFVFPNVILDQMEKHAVTGFAGVPSTFAILLAKSNIKSRKFSTLRYITQAGGAMAPVLQKEVVRVFSPAKLYVMYGATEASARLSYLNPERLEQKYGSIGKAIPNVDLFVADSKGNPIPVGRKGEIVARGANITHGYWKDPKETAKVLKYGLYFTGDLGYVDADGFLFITGRSKDMIKVGANRISAKEIEESILEYENILEVAVVGFPDDILGEAMDACVVLKKDEPHWQKNLIAFLKSRLPTMKVPTHFSLYRSLPKNSSGKIMKVKIKAQKDRLSS